MNAILNRNSENLKNCTIYVALFPCNECAKIIIQTGIKKILFLSDKKAHKVGTVASKKMFDAANVEYRYLILLNSNGLSFFFLFYSVCHEKIKLN